MTVVACHQLAPRVGDLAGNRAASLAAVRAAAAAGAAVVVLPELVTSGYVFASRAEAAEAGLAADDPLFSEWAEAAGGAVVVGGFCERGADGRLYNSAVVAEGGGADSVRAVYRKTHLWDREKLFFEAGDAPPPVVDTAAGRIGVLVCYDLEFPELTRALALRGAELLAVPTNWPLVARPPGERPPEVGIAMAAARVNRLAIACCDRAGDERGVAWTGGTVLIGADGWIATAAVSAVPAAPDASGPVAQLLVADLDLSLARDKRLTECADALADRRPELYGDVTADRSAVDERQRR